MEANSFQQLVPDFSALEAQNPRLLKEARLEGSLKGSIKDPSRVLEGIFSGFGSKQAPERCKIGFLSSTLTPLYILGPY